MLTSVLIYVWLLPLLFEWKKKWKPYVGWKQVWQFKFQHFNIPLTWVLKCFCCWCLGAAALVVGCFLTDKNNCNSAPWLHFLERHSFQSFVCCYFHSRDILCKHHFTSFILVFICTLHQLFASALRVSSKSSFLPFQLLLILPTSLLCDLQVSWPLISWASHWWERIFVASWKRRRRSSASAGRSWELFTRLLAITIQSTWRYDEDWDAAPTAPLPAVLLRAAVVNYIHLTLSHRGKIISSC